MTGMTDNSGDRAEWGKRGLSRLSKDVVTPADSAGVSSGDFGLRRVPSLPLSLAFETPVEASTPTGLSPRLTSAGV
jgi:hypothetical protein